MKNVYLKKGLVLGLIFLFVGVGIQPAFAEVSIEFDNSELVEIIVQFYETDRTYNNTVMLTKEQAEELENLINNFEIKINNADNRIERESIFKDTMVSLNDYDILPKSMSIEKAQRLVTGKEYNPVVVKLFERWYKRNQNSMGSDENILCLIGGNDIEALDTTIGRRIVTITKSIRNSLMMDLHNLSKKNPMLKDFIFNFLAPLFSRPFYTFFQPFGVGFELFFGNKRIRRGETEYDSCSGIINSVGLNGITSFNGNFYGHLPLLPFITIHSGDCIFYDYSGIVGYTGITLRLQGPEVEDYFLFGSALWFKIGRGHP